MLPLGRCKGGTDGFNFPKATGIIAADDVGLDLPSPEEARAHEDPLIAIIIKDETGQEIESILAKDVLPEPLK
jgi:hypothetical protein